VSEREVEGHVELPRTLTPALPLDAILRHVADGITVQDATGAVVYANDAAARLTGLSSGQDLVELEPAALFERLELLDGAGGAFPLERLPGRRALRGEEDVEETIGYRFHETGDVRWSIVRATPVHGENGGIVAAINVFHDVTARRLAEERVRFLAEAGEVLAESLDYDRTLAHVARLAVPRIGDWCMVYIVQPDGSIARLAVEHAGGRHRDVLERLREHEFDLAADVGVPHVVRTGEGELHPEADSRLVAADVHDPDSLAGELESLGICSWMCVPLAARGRTLGAISLLSAESRRRFGPEDLTLAQELARRAALAVDNARLYGNARQARADAERRAAAAEALELIDEGVTLLDRDGIVRLWNPAAMAITGVMEETIVGRRGEEVISGWAELLDRAPLIGGPETMPLEVDGTELWVSVSRVASPAGSVLTFRDVTGERMIEKLRTDFVSTVSHELRTPLAAIYGAAQTLRRDDMHCDDDRREELMRMIAVEAERLARIIDDILWTSRLESDSMHVSIESCDPLPIAEGVVDSARVHVPAGVEIALVAPATLPPVAADPDKVRQVLANLVDNAVKYSPDGGAIEVRVEQAPGGVRFAVQDEGLGIPSAERDHVFEKFYRLDPNLTRGVGGTGLGLYICRALVHRMNGRIWLDSRENVGSTFAFELPTA
jgi:PAS domain S-box-containing protein